MASWAWLARSTWTSSRHASIGLRRGGSFPTWSGLSIVSYLGDFGNGGILGGVGPFKDVLVGGRGVIPLWWDMVCLAVLSLAIYAGAMAQGGAAMAPASPPSARRLDSDRLNPARFQELRPVLSLP